MSLEQPPGGDSSIKVTEEGEAPTPRFLPRVVQQIKLLPGAVTRSSSIDFGIYLHTIFHSVFTFTVQSPQNLRSNPYNRKSENGS